MGLLWRRDVCRARGAAVSIQTLCTRRQELVSAMTKAFPLEVGRGWSSGLIRRIRRSQTGTVIVITNGVMLVEGGYLHSMKLLIERASDTPDPAVAPRARGGIFSRSLRRLGGFLLGW